MAQVTWLPAWWIILCRAEMFQAPVVALVSLFKQFAFTGVGLHPPHFNLNSVAHLGSKNQNSYPILRQNNLRSSIFSSHHLQANWISTGSKWLAEQPVQRVSIPVGGLFRCVIVPPLGYTSIRLLT
jgi:hypothetical protein